MSASRARRTRVVLQLANRDRDAERPRVVIKIGGSLLTWSGLIDRIEWLFAQRPDSRCLILCGGGPTADLVRRWQEMHGLSDEGAHRLAMRAVTFNEALLHSALPNSTMAGGLDEMDTAWEQGERPILACERFVRDHEQASDEPLPHNWDATSDSLAAWCAGRVGADELILAKSVDLQSDLTAQTAANRGLVDAHFPHVLAGRHVLWTNLRAEQPIITDWL